MLWFLLGSLFGGVVGLFSSALCVAAKNGDEKISSDSSRK